MPEWEIWNEHEVSSLEEAWGPPTKPKKTRHQLLINAVAKLIVGKSVLDVGCGFGHLYGVIKGAGAYLGIDSSPAMICKARGYFGSSLFKVRSGYDLSGLPSFDTVVCLDVVKHVPETWPILKQLWNKAKREIILVTNVGKTASTRITSHGPNKVLIYRVETLSNLLGLFEKLPNKGFVEWRRFDEKKGTIIFKVPKHA